MPEPISSSRSALALQIVEGAPDALIAFDAQSRVIFANPPAERLLGLTEAELLGRSQQEVLPDTAGLPLAAAFNRAMNERIAVSVETHDERSQRWHDFQATPSGDKGLVVRFIDVTERKRAEEALRTERQRFSDVLDQLPAYLVLLSPDYHVPFANRFFRERFGEAHGRRCFEYLFHRTEPCETCETYSVLRTNAPQRWQWTGPDSRNYDIYDFPFQDSDGSRLIMEVGLDITDRNRAEAELAKHRDHLEDEVKERTRQLEEANARLEAEIAERKRAEKQLAATLDSIGDGFFACDENWRFVHVNAAAERILGTRREKVLGTSLWDVFPLTLGTNLQREYRLAAAGEARDFETFYEPWGRWFQNRCFPRQGGGMSVYLEDITERKRAAEKLRQSEARFRRFYESGLLGVIFWNMDGVVTDANDKFLEMVGYDRDDLTSGRIDWAGMTPPEYRPLDEASVKELRVTGVNQAPFEKEYIRKDGSRVPILVAGAMLDDARVNGVAFVLDITERKRAEEELRRNREWLRVILSSIGDAVLATDTEGRITFMNSVAASLTGWTEPEGLGQPLQTVFRIINEDTRQPGQDAVALALRERRPTALANHTALIARDGREVPIEDSAAPILDGAGNVAGAVIVFHDVTEQRRSQAAVAAARTEAVNEKNRLRAVMHALPVGVALLDAEGGHVESNPGFDQVWGASRPPTRSVADYAAYKAWWTATGEPVQPAEWASARALQSGETVTGQEIDIQRFDGTRASVFNSATPIRDADGRVSGCAVAVVDISELKRTQQKLRDGEAVLRSFFDSPGVSRGLVELVDGCIVHVSCNAAAAELYGIDRESIAGKSATDAGASEEVARWWVRLYEEGQRTGNPVSAEYSRRDAAGRDRWLLATAGYLGTGPSGNARFAYTVLDLTDRKRAEQQLKITNQRLELAQLASGAGTWDWDVVADRIDWSARQFELFGLDPLQTAASFAAWEAVVHPEDKEAAAARIDEALRNHTLLDSEYRVIRPDGQVRWISAVGKGIYNEDHQAVRMAGLCVDITGRKQAAEDLRQSEERYRSLFDSMIEGFCLIEMIFDSDGRPADYRLLETNPAFELQTGLTNARGRLISEMLPDNEPHWFEIYGSVALTGQPARFVNETKALHRWFDVRAYRVGGPGSRKVAIVFGDITERKRAEEALRESELLLRTLADSLPEAAIYRYRLDAAGEPHVDFITAGIERLTGVPAAEYMSHAATVERNFVPEDRDRLNRAILASRDSLTQFEQELRHKHRVTGQIRWSLLRSTPKRNPDGSTIWDGIELDITARKQAEEAVAESRTKLDAALASMTDAVFISDAQGHFVEFNEAFATFHRFKNKEECATTFAEYPDILDVFLPDGTAAPLDMWAVPRALRGETATNAEYNLRRKDTGEAWIGSYSFGPIRDRDGAIVGSVVVGRDITELKRAEERLRQAQKLESIGLLAGGVAHDFNNLLVGVIGNASLAQEMLPEGHDAADLLRRIVSAGEQAAHLTRQMLAYAGKGRFLVEAISLSDLIPEISVLVQPSISKKIAVHLSLEPDLPRVEADRGQMQQVFMNLMLNAAEATGSNAGLISVKTGAQVVDAAYKRRNPDIADLAAGTYVYLEVRDTGCGMDTATRTRIFDPFFTTKFQGRGLGLAAVAGIVRAHKGAIQLTTAPGAGATFRVLFPAVASGATAPVRPTETRSDLSGKGTVLVVDDEPHVCALAQRALERQGYTVLLAESGPAAIDIVRTQADRIDLVVLDLSMPVMGGEEVLPRLRDIKPDLKIMVSSGFSEAETLRAFPDAPLSGFIQKPYTVRELAAEVKAAMA